MTYLGLGLFMLIFILLAPQPRAFLGNVSLGFSTRMTAWAPFSYFFLMFLLAALLVGIWVIHSWPKYVEPENPMAKYRREASVEEE